MAACGPFEKGPHVAVAVSGGADSLALLHLLGDWSRAAGGRITALTVDHGLRPESREEAEQVGRWVLAAGVDHHILPWTGPKPASGIQNAARRARYGLLTNWCREQRVLHLALAHQLDDQRETVAMRLARNQGAAGPGLSGMSLISVLDGVRLLRPLLGVPRQVLRTFLAEKGIPWIEDPSNEQLRFERIRWRQGLEGSLPTPDQIARWGAARVETELAMADLLMRSAEIAPAGHVLVQRTIWSRATEEVRLQAIASLIGLVAGGTYPPSRQGIARAMDSLNGDRPPLSLGGALIGSWRNRGLVCREAGAIGLGKPGNGIWDGRFEVDLGPGLAGSAVTALGEAGVAEIGRSGQFRLKDVDIPPLARPALPAVRDATGRLIFVPYMGFDPYQRGQGTQFRFLPRNSATSCGFTVAPAWPHTI